MISSVVEMNGADAIAGSILHFLNRMGSDDPMNAAIQILLAKEIATIPEKRSELAAKDRLNMKIMLLRMSPIMSPIILSLRMYFRAPFSLIDPIARLRTIMVAD